MKSIEVVKGYSAKSLRFLIRLYVHSCDICLLSSKNQLSERFKYPRRNYIANSVWEKITIDLFSIEKNKKIFLIVTDVLSRYTFLFKIEDKSAMTVAKKLMLLFEEEGYPLFIVSDNGKEFDNQLLKFIEEQFHVTHIYSRYYNPVGLIERKV
jgi:IS30 family transposase